MINTLISLNRAHDVFCILTFTVLEINLYVNHKRYDKAFRKLSWKERIIFLLYFIIFVIGIYAIIK